MMYALPDKNAPDLVVLPQSQLSITRITVRSEAGTKPNPPSPHPAAKWSKWLPYWWYMCGIAVCMCFVQYNASSWQSAYFPAFHKNTPEIRNISSISFIRGLAQSSADKNDSTVIQSSNEIKHIAFGMGMTYRQITKKLNANSTVANVTPLLQSSPFYKHFLPTLCSTIENNYHYKLYIAYDYNDVILANKWVDQFINLFKEHKLKHCKDKPDIEMVLVRCNYTGQPATAQNEAMMAAYADNNDYFYMANDDTRFVTKNWTTSFIQELAKMKPPNVGVVGPSYTRGNTAIMTYQFIHRTHFEIFHYFMPEYFTDWGGDVWISDVYDKQHSHKMKQIQIEHVPDVMQRYKLKDKNHSVRQQKTKKLVKNTKGLVHEYISKITSKS